MSDRTIEPDHVVRTAIQMLPTPDHGDGFWVELQTMLAAGVEQAGPPPMAQPPLGVVPAGSHRRSNLVMSAVAVAAVVLVVMAGTTLVRERGDGSTDTADLAGDTVASSTSASVPTSVAKLTGPAAEAPADAVLAWVSALGGGDADAAWAALGPASREHFGSSSAFAADGSALAESYGAWSDAALEDVIVTPLTSGGKLVVVTLVGAVRRDGLVQRRADAIPVLVSGGEAVVEPWAFAGDLEMVVPDGEVPAGEVPVVDGENELVIVIPRGVQAPTLRLDDGDLLVCGRAEGTELVELQGAPRQRCSYRPEGGLPAGRRVLTVAFLSPDGDDVSAESVLFEAA